MPDNLTQRFKKELEKQGIAATDAQITSYLQKQGLLQENQQQQLTPISNSIQQTMQWDAAPANQEQKINLLEGAGSLAWNLFDTALLGAPGLLGADDLLGEIGLKPPEYEEMGPAGRVGMVLGQAVGFMAPLSVIGGTSRAAVSLAKGSKAGIKRASQVVRKTAGEAGISKEAAEKVIRDVGAGKIAKTAVLPRYALKGEDINAIDNSMKGLFREGLAKEFPTLGDDILIKMSDDAVNAVRGEARHLNSIGQWLEARLATRFPDKERVSKYLADAAEMTLHFGLYNVFTDGVRSSLTDSEFTPGHDFYDALKFSAFLPLIHAIPGGGMPIWRTKSMMNQMLKKFKDTDYSKMSPESVNGLLNLLSKGSKFEAGVKNIAQNYKGKTLPKDEAIKVINEIIKKGGIDRISRDFIAASGKDLKDSLGRMIVGSMYFNAHMLLDTDLLQNLPKDEMWAHLLVGGFFTKRYKALYQQKYPTLNGFQQKLELLRTLNIDASALESYGRWQTVEDQIGIAHVGMKDNAQVNEIVRIFNNKRVREEVNDPSEAVGAAGLHSYDLVRWAHDVFDLHQISTRANGEISAQRIDIKNLSHKTLKDIEAKLLKIKINEKGETLNTENFTDWHEVMREGLVKGPAGLYLGTIASIARRLGIPVEGEPTMDGNLRVGKLRGAESAGMENEAIAQWNTLRNMFEKMGYLDSIEQVKPISYSDVKKYENSSEILRGVEADILSVPESLKRNNYEEGVVADIPITENGFLDSIKTFRSQQKLNSIYKILANDPRMSQEEFRIREALQETLGDEIPSILGKIKENIRVVLPKENENDPKLIARKDAAEPRLHEIARIWGISKADGRRKVSIDLESAESLVGLMETKGFLFKEVADSNIAYERVNNHFWRRLVESPDIGVKEFALIRLSVDNGLVGIETGGGGRPRLVWPSVETMKSGLILEYGENYKNTPEYQKQVKQYEEILSSIGNIKDKYIKIGTKLIDPSNIDGMSYSKFIEDAHSMIGKYDKIVGQKVKELRDVLGKYDVVNEKLNSLMDFFKNEKNEYKDIEQADVLEVREHLLKIVQDPEIKRLLGDDFGLVKNLSDKFGLDKVAIVEASEYSTSAKAIESLLKANYKKASRLQLVSNELIYNISGTGLSRIHGSKRLDMLTSLLVKDLKNLGVTLSQTKKLGLSELHDLFLENGKYGDFVNQLNIAAKAWGKNYTEKEWLEFSKQVRQAEQDISSHDTNTMEKFNIQYIPKKYGQYNSQLTQNNFSSHLDQLRIYAESSDWSSFEKQASFIVNEVKMAIKSKHFPKKSISSMLVDTPEAKMRDKKAQKEYERFMREAFNPILTNAVGMEKVPVISLEQGVGGKKILQINESISGKGELIGFINDMSNSGVTVYRLKRNGVYNNKKQNIRLIDGIDTIINEIAGKDIQLSHDMLLGRDEINIMGHPKYGVESKPLNGVSVATGLWNQLYVRTDNLVDGKLNKIFKKWYDNKLKSLEEGLKQSTTDKETSKLTNTINRFKILYEDMALKEKDSTNPAVRNMIRALYWDRISPQAFNELVHAAANKTNLGEMASSFFKYISLAEASGAKAQGRIEVLRTIRKVNKELPDEQKKYIDDYLKNPNLNLTVVADETMKSLNAEQITKSLLKQYEKEYSPSKAELDAMKGELKTYYQSLASSGIDAQSWLSSKAASVLYAFKGRSLGDNLAGLKPEGYFSGPEGSMLLKTNFVYDPYIARIMDKLKIDILSTESASKIFSTANKISLKGDIKSTNGMADLLEAQYPSLQKVGKVDTQLKVENFFLGKVTDRKGATSVSYALSDFLNATEYKSAIGKEGYIRYEDMLQQEASRINNIINGGREGMGLTLELVQELRESGEIFDKSQAGMVEYLMQNNVDSQSVLVKEPIIRMAVRRMMKRLKSPATDGSSYSILKPFIEGRPSVYANVDGQRRQIIYGEKRLSHEDKNIVIRDWNKLKFVVKIDGKDIQVGINNKGKYEFIDNKSPDRNYEDVGNKIEKTIENIRKQIDKQTKGGVPTLGLVHQYLREGALSHVYKKMDIHLSSMTLRMPNLGGDVAVHRIEGFYSPIEGNVVGVNALDLAVIHQGDFDVDAAFNIHDAPWKLHKAHSKKLGNAPDAITYPSKAYDLDIFENNGEMKRVGSAGGVSLEDGMQQKIANFDNSKMVFGSIKRVSSAISSLERLQFNSGKGIEVLSFDTPEFNLWLQRYKNTLQSIIDATKRPNFVSKAKADDILEWVLFGEAELGSMRVPEELRKELAIEGNKYGEANYGKGLIKLPDGLSPNQKTVYKESMIEVVKMLGRPQRLLSGIFDASGKRVPDISDINRLYFEMDGFFSNPQSWTASRLLWKYRDNQDIKDAVFDVYYGMNEAAFGDKQQFFESYYSKKKFTPTPTEPIFGFGLDKKSSIKTTPGGSIASIVNGHRDSFRISKEYIGNVKTSKMQEIIGKSLSDLQDFAAVIGERGFNEKLTEMIGTGEYNALPIEGIASGKIMELSDMLKGTPEKTFTPHADIQRYSVMAHILENEMFSLQRYIKKNESFRGSSDSVSRAKFRMNMIEAIINGIDLKEANFIKALEGGKIEKGKGVRKHFKFNNYDLTNHKKSFRVDNKSNNVNYIYREVKRGGKTLFEQAGWIRAGGYRYLNPKHKYVVLKNPLRYEPISKSEVIDAYSLLESVGETIPEYITGMSENMLGGFYKDVGDLRKDLGVLAKDAFQASKDSPYAIENWMLESKLENVKVAGFFNKWLQKLSGAVEGRELEFDISNQLVYELSAHLMKPRPIAGKIAAADGKVQLPAFKINKRMVNSVFRFLKDNGYDEVAADIATTYGRAYRRRKYMVMSEAQESMYVSNLYNKNIFTKDRNFLVDLTFNKGYLYAPSLMQRIRTDIRKRTPREYWKNDINGNLRHIIDYGNFQNIQSEYEFYLDRNNIREKENNMRWCE